MVGSIVRGMVAGVAGTVVMTAFQKFVEMPLTGRETSYAPADFAERILPIHPRSQQGREQLNLVTHHALGTMWGAAYGVTAHTGLHGAKAIAVVFPVVYTGDVLLNTALGLYKPGTWTAEDWTVDLINKFVQAAATGVLYDNVFRPTKTF
ncbi:hypothetical protein IWX75_002688 [Arthrobacter sp. CAN_A6]|uniref:hypothetical protein n=1 Tax=Arthrobacter sp. CAN_A6 TaxID=2787721 RepID=UPI0018CB6320